MENKNVNVEETIDMREVTEDTFVPEEPTTDDAKAEDTKEQQPKTPLWKKGVQKAKEVGPVKIVIGVGAGIVGFVLIKKGVRAVRAAVTPLREIEWNEPAKALAETPIVKDIPDNLADAAQDLCEVGAAAMDAQQAVKDTQDMVQAINAVGEAATV